MSLAIDRSDKVGQCHATISRDFLQASPKRILKADTRLVSGDDDRAFDNR
jgi:hypothetical protein